MILGEEVGEIARAIIEGSSENYREELIQLAAVAIAAIEDYDRGEALRQIEDVCPEIEYRNGRDE